MDIYSVMKRDNSQEFLRFSIESGVLRFGNFETKAGRQSPYFFNLGNFSTGRALSRLGSFYAKALIDSKIPFDMLFGPAYKGISLAAATAIALHQEHGRDVPFTFNRKEVKDHGEGGRLIGSELKGRIMVIDDVISAGTSVAETVALIRNAERKHPDTKLSGVLISINREERGKSEQSAAQEVEQRHKAPVISIATLSDLVDLLETDPNRKDSLAAIKEYRSRYGVV